MNIWEVHNDEQQVAARAPPPGSKLFVIKFPFKICDQTIIRYYSSEVGEKNWNFCQSVAQKYGINIHCYGKNLDMHPIHRLVECCFPCNQKPAHLILTIPESLSRHKYLVWTELFMREIYELLLDEAYKSYGTTCWNLTSGFLEHNTSATGPGCGPGTGLFKAETIVRPITPYGRTFKDDFAVAKFTELPLMNKELPKKMAVPPWLSGQAIAGWQTDIQTQDPCLSIAWAKPCVVGFVVKRNRMKITKTLRTLSPTLR